MLLYTFNQPRLLSYARILTFDITEHGYNLAHCIIYIKISCTPSIAVHVLIVYMHIQVYPNPFQKYKSKPMNTLIPYS